MKIEIIGKNVSITKAMRDITEEKLSKLNKYLVIEDDTNARVLARTYGTRQKIEVTIQTKMGILRAEAEDFDYYAALDNVLDKLQDQIRRQKTRLEKRHRPSITEALLEEEPEEDIVVRSKDIYLEPITLDEAILQMELSGHTFYAYQDEESDNVCIVYLRRDGGYGVIETHKS